MMIQLNPPIPVETPRGKAQAMFVIDYSAEHDLYWTCFLDESGESWTFSNKDVRAQANLTLGRAAPKPGARHLKLVNATEVAVVPLASDGPG